MLSLFTLVKLCQSAVDQFTFKINESAPAVKNVSYSFVSIKFPPPVELCWPNNTSLFDEFLYKLGFFWHEWASLKRE
jgi:hypothetical protein